MKRNYQNTFRVFVLLLIAILASLSFNIFAEDTVQWKWPEGYKKPVWWDWGKRYSEETPVRGGYLRVASHKYIGVMNPNHFPVGDWVSMSYLYDGLVINGGNFQSAVPWLAESWKYINPLIIEMSLRKGVKFHDGTPFNAESVKYQIEWIKDKRNGCWNRGLMGLVTSVEIINEHTVQWHLKKSWGAFTGNMAGPAGYAISKNALERDLVLLKSAKLFKSLKTLRKKMAKQEKKMRKVESKDDKKYRKFKKGADKLRKKLVTQENELAKYTAMVKGHKKTDVSPIGTGRYKLEAGDPGNFLKLKRNPNWWFAKKIGRDMPYFDGIVVRVIPDPSVQLATARAGKLDFIGVDKPFYRLLKNDPKFYLDVSPLPHFYGLFFNHAKGPCKDLRVRKAISHAIDRKAILVGTQLGLGTVASCVFPETHWAHNPNLKPVDYDPELSRKLLAEAGYTSGLTLKGHVRNSPAAVSNALAYKAMLAKVGIDLKYDVLEPAAADDRTRNLEFDVNSGSYQWIQDPDIMTTNFYTPQGGHNFGRSTNEKAIALINQAREETDETRRKELYWKVEEALYENYEDAWVYWPQGIMAFQKNVRGWNHSFFVAGQSAYWTSHSLWFKDGHP